MDLIRPQARAARRDDGLGSIDLTRVRLSWTLPALLMLLVIAGVTFMVFGEHQRRVVASGQLVSTEGLLAVTATASGVLLELHVAEGQPVEAGELLATLNVDTRTDAAQPVGTAVAELLQRQLDQRQLDLQRVAESAEMRQRSLREQIELEDRQAAVIRAQRPVLSERLAQARAFLERVRQIGAGTLSQAQLRAYEAEVAGHESALAELSLRELELGQRQSESRHALAVLPLESERNRTSIEREIAELQQTMARNSASRSIQLRATRSGVVSATLARVGQSVAAGQPVLQLLPAGAQLEAELWLPSEAVGVIAEGTPVQLRLRSYPFRRFGLHPGQVASVSATALEEESVRRLSGLPLSGPRYRVRVHLPQQLLSAPDGSSHPLRLGMQFDADLLLERQPLYRALWPQSGTDQARGQRS